MRHTILLVVLLIGVVALLHTSSVPDFPDRAYLEASTCDLATVRRHIDSLDHRLLLFDLTVTHDCSIAQGGMYRVADGTPGSMLVLSHNHSPRTGAEIRLLAVPKHLFRLGSSDLIVLVEVEVFGQDLATPATYEPVRENPFE